MKKLLIPLCMFILSHFRLSKPEHVLCVLTGLVPLAVKNEGDPMQRLQVRMQGVSDKINAILDKADDEERDLSEAEDKELKSLEIELKSIMRKVELRKQTNPDSAFANDGNGSQSNPQNNSGATKPRSEHQKKLDRQGNFLNFGEYAQSVKHATTPGAQDIDPRLAASDGGQNESTGADGGFLVPPGFVEEIQQKVEAEDSLMSRVDQLNTSRNSVEVPQDNLEPWNEENNIRAYWTGEAKKYQSSKGELETKEQKLHKLTALVPVTDELLEDTALIDGWIRKKTPEIMAYKIDEAIVKGDGVGKPKGVRSSGSTVTVAKEAGQAADTIVYNNITKMYSRMYAGAMRRGIWVANQDAIPALMDMVLPGGQMPAYVPGNSLANQPHDALIGKPIIYHETAETVGTLGDVMFWDPLSYLMLKKAGGLRFDQSMHLYFDHGEQAFRFTYRLSGSPWYDDPIKPAADGSLDRGTAVLLESRE